MAARHDAKAVAKPISFGTTQERKMFPYHCAPDRLGIEGLGVRGSPSLGPGSYLGPQSGTPGPAAYGPFPERPRRPRPGPAPAPFCSSSPRFPSRLLDRDRYPGPGAYNVPEWLGRKAAWPGAFGAPARGALPQPQPRMVKMQVQKMTVDKKFQKNQGREAYLKLYHG
ncbi:protein pitchfork [Onychostruthus taczanowskii]|uniref:protein pitchfork n=1 Tax=Onychostruthus taczanowskii TaxID=356909 RepID=UPI001B80B6B0|nr:protein pitchfork [Onychostruthus taczanowskii]